MFLPRFPTKRTASPRCSGWREHQASGTDACRARGERLGHWSPHGRSLPGHGPVSLGTGRPQADTGPRQRPSCPVCATCVLVCFGSGKSNPYCEISMGSQSYTTRTLQDTLNPKWNFNCQFFIKDLYQDVLCLTMFDRDQFSPDGKVELVQTSGPRVGARAPGIASHRPKGGGTGPPSPRLAWQLCGRLLGKGSLRVLRCLTPSLPTWITETVPRAPAGGVRGSRSEEGSRQAASLPASALTTPPLSPHSQPVTRGSGLFWI